MGTINLILLIEAGFILPTISWFTSRILVFFLGFPGIPALVVVAFTPIIVLKLIMSLMGRGHFRNRV